jgi:hypothetical protein
MVLIVERKKHNASPLLMSLVVWTHFCISFKGDGLFACYIFMYTKIYLVLMPRFETDPYPGRSKNDEFANVIGIGSPHY